MTENIVCLIPAHNEAGNLPATIRSVRAQTIPVDRILVISDNSTDNTVTVARSLGVQVMETVDNTARKAGALNQALTTLPNEGLVLVMDADTALDPGFMEAALNGLHDPTVGGVGAVFHAPPPTSYLELCQHLEWSRYAEQTDRTGRTFVMSGTAALIRWEALDAVHARFGHWYDETTITEDSRLSLDLKLTGWVLRSPLECRTVTETMPTVQALFQQRRRWYLGAMQNVTDAGFNRVTVPYWWQQVMLTLSVTLMSLLIGLTITATILGGPVIPEPFWVAVGAVFAVERIVTVWDQPIRYRLFAATVLPELGYALILHAAFISAVWQKITGSTGTWTHLTLKEA